MAVTYTIQGRLDGLNAYVNACRTNPYKGAKCKRSNQKICRCSIPYELREKDREIIFPVRVEITWYEKDRRRDPDNIASAKKYILDSLVEAGVFPDDGWKYVKGFTNVFRLFYHCLLHTNLEDKRYCGREIKAGQFVSSITRISAETGLTESQVRTALKKLKDTGYLSTKSTNKYTIYTVNDYEKYIDCGQVIEATAKVENGTKMEQPVERKMEQTDKNAKKNCEKSKENCEKSNKKAINECFEKLWKQYPNKRGKGQVSDAKKKTLYEIGEEKIERALKRYLDDLSKDSSWRKPQNGSTFFNSGYVDYLDENYEKPPEPKPQRNPASILECERDYDFDNLEQQLFKKQLE